MGTKLGTVIRPVYGTKAGGCEYECLSSKADPRGIVRFGLTAGMGIHTSAQTDSKIFLLMVTMHHLPTPVRTNINYTWDKLVGMPKQLNIVAILRRQTQ